jgi:L-arabinonolactonase
LPRLARARDLLVSRARLGLLDHIFGERVSTYEPAAGEIRHFRVPGRVCAFTTRKGRPWNQVVAAFADGFALLDHLTGERKDIARVDADKPTVRMNDGRTDRQGRFIVGGMDEPATQSPSAIWLSNRPPAAFMR